MKWHILTFSARTSNFIYQYIGGPTSIDLICLQETWLSSESSTLLYDLPNYQLISRGKYCSNHGGLITYVHNNYNWEPLNVNDQTTGWENLFVKITHRSQNTKKYIIGNVYRVPNETVHDLQIFNDEFAETLEILQSKRLQIYLCGDYNIDLLKIYQKNQNNLFFENLIAAGFQPKISLPTRLTDYSATLIDNIFCNRIDNNESGILINHISDHQMIYTYSTEKVYTTCVRQYVELETNDAQAMNTFLNKLQDSNITDKLDQDPNTDPNENLKQFLDTFTHLKNEHLPKRRVTLNKRKHKVQPWMTTAILKSINSRDKLYKSLMLTPRESPIILKFQRNFKTYKNIIRRCIMLAKRDYYNKLFYKHSKNLKMTWKAINDTLNRHKTKSRFPETFKQSNGKIISDPKEIATAFNDYFISIGEMGAVTQPPNCHFSDYLGNKPKCNLQFHRITQGDVAQIIDSLKPKTSTGIDNISSKLLKRTKDNITAPLTIIINQMITSGIFPDALKISKVIPLYKKGDELLLSNYRPTALLTSISKIFEKAILTQLTLYLEDNKMIHPHQYGFRKRHSTEYAALHITDYINYKMDVGKIPVNVYLDLSKAFDTLIDELAYKLIKSYLENRKQFVEFNKECSEMKSIENGVPQGSILGPLLLLIYINDIPNASNIFNFLMYADDTTLYCCLEDINHVNKQAILNQELDQIHNWLIANGLKLNTNKSKYMVFAKPNRNIPIIELHIDTANIDKVQNFNFLGLHVSSDITWNLHMDEVSKKISRITGILKKLQLIVPKNILLTIYHTEPLFKFYDILKVNDIYKYKLLTFYYNIKRSNVPVYLSKFLPDVSHGARNYEIRNPRLQPPVYFHEYITGTCRYQLTVLLNEINSIVEPLDPLKSVVNNVQNVTLLGLKRTIKSYLLQKYSYYCVIPICYVCQHYVV